MMATDLEVEEIVSAAVAIYEESGLDAVSMRRVSRRLGVSPIPLYSRVGNKEALLDALAERLLTDLAPPVDVSETWEPYAARWAHHLRARLGRARDSRLILSPGRAAYVRASRPLVDVMRRSGMTPDAAVQACRLLTWAVIGFGVVEGSDRHCCAAPQAGHALRPGGDAEGVGTGDADALFSLHIGYLIRGIATDAAAERPADSASGPMMPIPDRCSEPRR